MRVPCLFHSDTLASIESVKAASDVYVPVDCVVNEVNGELDNNPGLVNEAAYRAFCGEH